MMSKQKGRGRSIYRKWDNPEEGTENYLRIDATGKLLEIRFEDDRFGEKVTIFESNAIHPFNSEVFIKHKEVLLKSDWIKAVKRVHKLVNK